MEEPGDNRNGQPPPSAAGWDEELASIRSETTRIVRSSSATSLFLVETNDGQFCGDFGAQVAAHSRSEGSRFAAGQFCRPRRFPYEAFVEVARQLAGALDLAEAPWKRYLDPLLRVDPGIAPPGVRPVPLPRLEPRQERSRLTDLLGDFFLQLGRESPLTICLRGLHLADADSLALLESVARKLHQERDEDGQASRDAPGTPSRLVLLAVYRKADAEVEEKWAQAAYESIRHLASQPYTLPVVLPPLSGRVLGEWIAARAPGLRLSGRALEKLHEKSEGAPRLVDEFLRRLSPGHSLRKTGGQAGSGRVEAADAEDFLPLPPVLGEALLERYQGLEEEDRRCLAALSVSGRVPLEEAVVADLRKVAREGGDPPAGIRPRPVAEAESSGARSWLERMEAEGFLDLRPDGESVSAAWCVESLPELIYGQLSPGARRRYHRALYDALRYRAEAVGYGSEVLAYHAREAGVPSGFRKHAVAAAERLGTAQCLEAAAEIYEDLLAEAPAADGLSPRSFEDGDQRSEVVSKLVDLLRVTKRYARAQQELNVLLSIEPAELTSVYRQMGEIYQEMGERTRAGHFLEESVACLKKTPDSLLKLKQNATSPAKQRELVRSLLSLGSFYLEVEDAERARKALEEALDGVANYDAAGPDGRLRARAYLLRAQAYELASDHAQSLRTYLKALELAEKGGDAVTRSKALIAVGNARLARGEYRKALETFRQGVEFAEECASRFDLARFHLCLGNTYNQLGDQRRALECYERSLKSSRRLGDLEGIAASQNSVGNVYRLRGETEQAAKSFEEAIKLYSRLNDEGGMAEGMTHLASVLERQGEYSKALDYCVRALVKLKRSGSKSEIAATCYRIGRIHEARGDLDKAAHFARKSAQLRKELNERIGLAYSHVQLADQALLRGEILDAHGLCQEALAEFHGQGNRTGELVAGVTEAEIFVQLGLAADASKSLRRVAELANRREHHGIEGICLLKLAEIAIQAAEYRDAGSLLEDARKIFRRLKHERHLAEVDLEACALALYIGHVDAAAEHLEQAYARIERLGCRDLVPRYFLLRCRVEAEREPPDPEAVHRFQKRALLEAEGCLFPAIRWRIYHGIGLLERSLGRNEQATSRFREARKILEQMCARLPRRFQESFFKTRQRAEVLQASSDAARPSGRPSVGGEEPSLLGEEEPKRRPASPPFDSLNDRLLNLHESIAALGGRVSLRKIAGKVIDAALDFVIAERALIALKRERDERPLEVSRSFNMDVVPPAEKDASAAVAGHVLRTGESLLSASAASDESLEPLAGIRALGSRSLVCVPLKLQNEIIGAIYFDNGERQKRFDRDDLKMLETFARRAAAVVANARLLDKNLRLARELREGQRATEAFNIKLRNTSHKRNAQLAIARADLEHHQRLLESRYKFHNIVGESNAMQEIFFLLERLSDTQLPVFIQGESGTGKELIARAIHFNSPRRNARFVTESCGAVSETLMETEIFGHEKGAFTDAVERKKGLIELADGGTLFLDEIGDMGLGMQQKLLRALQEGEVRRVGGKSPVKVDVRVISASKRDLQELLAEGKFREDLYYRLNGVCIRLPSLRERTEDIRPLVDHFLLELAAGDDTPPKRFSPAAMRSLAAYDWPGNVRELRNLVERTVLITNAREIKVGDIHFDASGIDESPALAVPSSYREARDSFERRYIENALKSSGGNVSKASRVTGLSRESLYRLLRKHAIQHRS